jgi:DNA-binding MarR family transcriptional regulator
MTDLSAAFWAASRAIRAEMERELQRHGLHAGQHLLVARLLREDGLTPGELADRIGVETPTVTRMAQRMERAGLVRRVPDRRDRRLVRIYLTEAGERLRAVVPAATRAVVERALDGFSPAERERFAAFLGRMTRNLELGD